MKLSAPVFRLRRRARTVARESGIPLHKALDRIARDEGFRSWSQLGAHVSHRRPVRELLGRMEPGDLVLLAARPGHGKTLLGLELIAEAMQAGQRGFFFTLECHEADVLNRFQSIGTDMKTIERSFTLDTSDDICADHIIGRMEEAPRGSVAVIDYLQLLDQKRRNPELAVQLQALKEFAARSQLIVVMISQVDRSFDLLARPSPELSDIRLPNPLDLTLFAKACFLHDGEIRLEAVA